MKDYPDRVLGSWVGRAVGSAVGAPTEFRPDPYIKWKYGEIDGHIKDLSKPYVNDDEMYEIVALIALEKFGIGLNAADLAKCWRENLYTMMFTAEARAYKNLKLGFLPPWSARLNNPWYDAIGAQMRADIWGMICPGMPQKAAEFAAMDASISHTGVGVDGAMYVAALVSLAMVEKDIPTVIDRALEFIPADTEYSNFVRRSIGIGKAHDNWRDAREKILNGWKPLRKQLMSESTTLKRWLIMAAYTHRLHVIPNAGLVVLALLYGKGDLGKSVCIASMAGWDTDCNAGNVGAIIGAFVGEKSIEPRWKNPLNNTLHTKLRSAKSFKLTELAERTQSIGGKVLEKYAPEQ